MNSSKAIGLGGAGILVCAGAVAAVLLRAAVRLWAFDYETGFYTDGGVLAWAGVLLPLAAVAAAGWFCARNKGRLEGCTGGKHPVAGVLALASGLALLWTGGRMAADYAVYRKLGQSAYESANQWVHVAFLVMCLVFGVVQAAMAAGLFTGRDLFARAPLLYVVAVLWGAAYMVLTYVFYAKSSPMAENLCTMGGAAALMLSLLYLCRMLAGVDPQGAGQWLVATGGAAVALGGAFQAVDLALRLAAGREYAGEMPVEFQVCGLSVALFVLAFLAGILWGRKGGTPETAG